MYVYVYVYIYIYVDVYNYIWVPIHIYVYIYIYTYTYIYVIYVCCACVGVCESQLNSTALAWAQALGASRLPMALAYETRGAWLATRDAGRGRGNQPAARF